MFKRIKVIIITILLVTLSTFITGCSTADNNKIEEEPINNALGAAIGDILTYMVQSSINEYIYSSYEIEDIFNNDIENLEINNKYVGTRTNLKEGLNCIYRYKSKKSQENYKILKASNIEQNIIFYEENEDQELLISFFINLANIPDDLVINKNLPLPEYFISPVNIYVKDGIIKLIRIGEYKNLNEITMDKIYINRDTTTD